MTASQELVLVDAAITSLLTGKVQAYSEPGGRSVQRLSYEQLVKRKAELEALVARETNTAAGTSGAFVARFRDPE